MKSLVVSALVISVFICLPTGQTNEHSVQEKFLARQSAPLIEYEATRTMEARNSRGIMYARLEIKTWLSQGNRLQYQILNGHKENLKYAGKVYSSMLDLLDSEQKAVRTNSFKKGGFLTENYNFWKVEDLGGTFQLSLKAKRKGDLLINGMLFVDLNGKLIRSEGLLAKNPSLAIRRTFVVFSYTEILGVTLPIHYDSEVIVWAFGKWLLSTSYQYTSVNGRPVPENQ